jgi:hypothetical protein
MDAGGEGVDRSRGFAAGREGDRDHSPPRHFEQLFMPVQIAEAPAAPKDATPPAGRIEILTPCGMTLRIEGAVDARTLGAVLKAMCS